MKEKTLPKRLSGKGAGNLFRMFLLTAFCSASLICLAQKQVAVNPSSIKINFSYAGYKAGSEEPPNVPAVFTVRPTGGDDTKLLQSAIDAIGNLPLQKNGFRGALQLREGRFKVSGQLHLNKSGLVLRGIKTKTTIVATGIGRRSLIKIGNDEEPVLAGMIPVTDKRVPEGSQRLSLENLQGIKVGDEVVITRPCTANWIADLGMNKAEGMFVGPRGLQWPVGSRELIWNRTITGIDSAKKQITLDAPITTALEAVYGGGMVQKVIEDKCTHLVGIEGITMESDFSPTNKLDEEHAWFGIAIDYAKDVWVRDVVARHFVSSAVRVGRRARQVSIANCGSEQPVSEPGGYRRQSFLVEGQQVLVKNCTSDSGMNDFAVGYCAAGPNVFFDCTATHALGASGSFESWASGVLYEKVTIEGNDLKLTYDFTRSQGGGWTAANSVVWNSSAKNIEALGPFDYPNLVVSAETSLYQTQLTTRFGKSQPQVTPISTLYKNASLPQITEFTVKDIPADLPPATAIVHPLQMMNGRFVMDGKVVWGGITGDQFWRGQPFPAGELNSGNSITRFVPGKEGRGLTEDLPQMAQSLVSQNIRFYNSVTGLWYDRRRDDHSTKKRDNSNVWAPFYEMPWARSGQGKAWDGLSLYDLNKYNPWFFNRAKAFAQLCDENGLILYYNLYDTHNLLEYVTHWVDYPWRPVNNLNQTGLPEPMPVEPWARLHLANQFYNPDNPVLRQLHHDYIFHVLDELGAAKNIIFTLGIQYSGPLNFQQFFLQTINEWEKQNNRKVRVGIAASKGVTDAVLSNPDLAKQIDVIDTRFWQYRPDGLFSNSDSLWAPPGGVNHSYREMVGEAFLQTTDYPLPTTQELMYRQVREYTDKFPGKAVVSVYNETSPIASVMAGGAQVLMQTPKERGNGHLSFNGFVQEYLAEILMNLKPEDGLLENPQQNWCLTDKDHKSLLIYSLSGDAITFTKNVSNASYTAMWFDPLSERIIPLENISNIRSGFRVQKPSKNNWLLLLKAKE